LDQKTFSFVSKSPRKSSILKTYSPKPNPNLIRTGKCWLIFWCTELFENALCAVNLRTGFICTG